MLSTEFYKDVALVNLPSVDAAQCWKEPIGLLFIDGNHFYEGVKDDFESWDPFVRVGGIVAFDDARKEECGPYRLVREILASGRYVHVKTTGKIAVLRKVSTNLLHEGALPTRKHRLLVACHDLVLTGGLLRFDRLAHSLRKLGHSMSFVTVAEDFQAVRSTSLPVLTYEQAKTVQWDATMVPGGSFPEETLNQLSLFDDPTFGIRVQHVLNDQTRHTLFETVNARFKPHLVIFNSLAWPAGSYTSFQADRFHELLGAVDPVEFRPRNYRSHPLTVGNWIIGGLANKNPTPLIEALYHLPDSCELQLYGKPRLDLAKQYPELFRNGRVKLLGTLEGNAVPDFYQSVDCIVHTEEFAGWANLVAEAMASGVPVVCTQHGTRGFAHHRKTALVVEQPTPQALASNILELMDNSGKCRVLTECARTIIQDFSWDNYALNLLKILQHDGNSHYLHAPEIGLYGKWARKDRVSGLNGLLSKVNGLNILDLGSAEGGIALAMLQRGASLVHGFELDSYRVSVANGICAAYSAEFRTANLNEWNQFTEQHRDLLLDKYDIVLYLGIHHHLKNDYRTEILLHALDKAKTYFAIRTPANIFETERLDNIIINIGFLNDDSTLKNTFNTTLGECRIYKRNI